MHALLGEMKFKEVADMSLRTAVIVVSGISAAIGYWARVFSPARGLMPHCKHHPCTIASLSPRQHIQEDPSYILGGLRAPETAQYWSLGLGNWDMGVS